MLIELPFGLINSKQLTLFFFFSNEYYLPNGTYSTFYFLKHNYLDNKYVLKQGV